MNLSVLPSDGNFEVGFFRALLPDDGDSEALIALAIDM